MRSEAANRWTKTFPLVLLLMLAARGAAVAAQASLPRLPAALLLEKGTDSPGQVTFNHETHVDAEKPACTVCHSREFRILKTSRRTAITHTEMDKGKYCGSCHDGKKAFAMDDCTFCHQS